MGQQIENCAVCGDVAHGFHYNVPSCFGCKTFFRRAVVSKRRYYCEKDDQCDVSARSGRRSCRACRLNKCLSVGMRGDALRQKRDGHGRNTEDQLVINTEEEKAINVEEDALQLIIDLTKMDLFLRQKKVDRFRTISEAMKLSREVNGVKCPEYFGREDLRIVEMVDMAYVTSGELYSLLEWAEKLEFFRHLPIHTRTALLRRFAVYQQLIEAGFFTASSGLQDMWLLPNGTCMPRDLSKLPAESQTMITVDRAWRQKKLYNRMTEHCIDDVALPMRRLDLLPEEILTLKVIMFCQCGIHLSSSDRSADSLTVIKSFKDRVIQGLFAFYESKSMLNYEERFGNILLLTSGIVSAAQPLHECYQIQRVFGFVRFDRLTNLLLFQNDDLQFSLQ